MNKGIYFFAFSFFAILAGHVTAQSTANLFYNNGSVIYVDSSAILHVQGDMVNASGSSFTNNGLLNVEGDFTNNATFKTDAAVGEGTVRMIGNTSMAGSTTSGTQTIGGNMATAGTASFYNLVIDRGSAGQPVALGTNVIVSGSLIWNGSSTAASTYSPSAHPATLGSNSLMQVRGNTPTGNGIIQMYSGGADYGVYISNPSANAMAGYQPVGTYNYSGATGGSAIKPVNDQYLQSRGADGASAGLSILVNGSGAYTFPVGTPSLNYNPIQVNFPSAQTNMQLTCKFTENSSLTSGANVFTNYYDQAHSIQPAQTSAYIAAHPDFVNNPGLNIYQKSSCTHDSGWFIMNTFIKNHGYWSLEQGTANGVTLGNGTLNGTYSIQAFPHGYTDYFIAGSNGPNKRLVKEDVDGFTATPSAANFQAQVEANINSYSDFMTYSYIGPGHGSFASCNDATGIAGGSYSSFSHFAIGTSSSPTGQSLPVTMIGLSADPIDNQYIRVSWATASELNDKGFEVERSEDGISFANIGWVSGNGTTSEQHNYVFNDHNAAPNTTYYYRLNQVDVDGHNTLTYVVSAMITDGPSITVSEFYPNPTTGGARLVITTTDAQPVSVRFYDVLGKLIQASDNNQVAYGTNALDFDINALADATYTAIIRIGANTYSKKIVLVK